VGRLAILRGFPREELLKVMTFVTLPGLLGPLIGPTLGGWLTEGASWHWVFLINLPVGLAGLIAARRYMPDLRPDAVSRFDLGGFVLFSCGLVLVTLALQGLGEHAIGRAVALWMLVAGLAAMVGYWLHAARTEHPLFSLALFRIPTFAIGIAGNLFSRLGTGAMPFLLPLFLQVGLGYSPSHAGMSLIPMAAGMMLCKLFAERVIERLGYRTVLVGNTVALGVMIAAFALVKPDTPYGLLLAMLAVFGVINSLQFTAMNTLTLGDLGPDTASGGNSLLSVVMQLSMSLGVAVAAALLSVFSGVTFNAGGDAVLGSFHATFVGVGLISVLAACIFLQLGRREGPAAPGTVVDEG